MKPAVAWISVLLLGAQASAQDLDLPETTLDAPGVIDSTLCNGHFIVSARINQRIPVRLIVDTGSSYTVVDRRIAPLLETRDGNSVTLHGSGGESVELTRVARIEWLSLGPMTVHNCRAVVHDLGSFRAGMGAEIDGVIGFPAFRDVLLTLDYPAEQIRVAPGALDPAGALTYVRAPTGDSPSIALELGSDGEVLFEIDSGSNGGLTIAEDCRVEYTSEPVDVGAALTIGGVSVTRKARMAGGFDLAGVRFEQPIVALSEGLDSIGAEVLRHFSVTFDQRNKLVRFTPGPDTPPVVATDHGILGRGFAVGVVDDRFCVIRVFDDQQSAGLIEEGDIVLAVGGIPVAEIGCRSSEDLRGDADEIVYRIERDGEILDVTVPIVELVP